MRRVVVTGLGAVSCIGNSKAEILDSLKNGRSGIVANESFQEMGLRSQVSGSMGSVIMRQNSGGVPAMLSLPKPEERWRVRRRPEASVLEGYGRD